ncbi:hypothetical protein AcV7_006010 [Taiwanofungus camphoratus]|nr:hypothetical protein AcV7_006010 [Antrodia cinnamomea]
MSTLNSLSQVSQSFEMVIDVFTSILLCRFFLNLRQVHESKEDILSRLSQLSDLEFAPGKVSNTTGALLNYGTSLSDDGSLLPEEPVPGGSGLHMGMSEIEDESEQLATPRTSLQMPSTCQSEV